MKEYFLILSDIFYPILFILVYFFKVGFSLLKQRDVSFAQETFDNVWRCFWLLSCPEGCERMLLVSSR